MVTLSGVPRATFGAVVKEYGWWAKPSARRGRKPRHSRRASGRSRRSTQASSRTKSSGGGGGGGGSADEGGEDSQGRAADTGGSTTTEGDSGEAADGPALPESGAEAAPLAVLGGLLLALGLLVRRRLEA